MREYQRWTTTTINAFSQPLVDRYLERLESGLRAMGFAGKFTIKTSSGGAVTPETARRFPVRMLESGPAAGVLMSSFLGRLLDRPDVLSFDMGGTTAKGAIVHDRIPVKKYELEVARVHEFKAGSGLPVRIPAIDMIEIGSGGGSIAEIDERGLIRVGPRSAGAEPGPACYSRGGTRATLTDANLVLGYLDPGFFLGGRMRLDRDAAESAVAAGIGAPLGLDTARAAWGIHEIASEDVARAFRVHASERGFDYRRSAMVAFGGCGPIHALRIARKLRIPSAILPLGAGVASAIGMLVSPIAFEVVRSERVQLADLSDDRFEARFASLIEEAASFLTAAGVERGAIGIVRKLDMRYRGQGYEIEIVVPEDLRGAAALAELAVLFARAYEKVFSVSYLTEPLEIVNWKLEASGPVPEMSGRYGFADGNAVTSEARKGSRRAYFPEGGYRECAVFDRYALGEGDTIEGPALVEEREATVVVRTRRSRHARPARATCPIAEIRIVGMTGMDAVSLGIMWDRLIAVTNEIVESLVRTSFSTNVRESYDLSCLLFDDAGRPVAQGTFSNPAFTGTGPMTLQHMLRRFPADGLQPGDVIATNDPWFGTGHLYDVNVMAPVFLRERLIGFTMSITHLPDVGGLGDAATAREVYEEGLRLPICKLRAAGTLNDELLEVVATNVRVPEQTIGDLMANVTCNDVGARFLAEFMEEYGLPDLTRLSDAIRRQCENAMRAKLAEIPAGTYRNALEIEGPRERRSGSRARSRSEAERLASILPEPIRRSTPESTCRCVTPRQWHAIRSSA